MAGAAGAQRPTRATRHGQGPGHGTIILEITRLRNIGSHRAHRTHRTFPSCTATTLAVPIGLRWVRKEPRRSRLLNRLLEPLEPLEPPRCRAKRLPRLPETQGRFAAASAIRPTCQPCSAHCRLRRHRKATS
ncbi:hypothetical protein M8818_002974 [Zalaria obscura]|uniref:Uncharacterized protein n=1 Tax=Zalaria obscura TaxID=2024903 RepID=A0ACC3SFK1_9PEZI